MAAPTDELTIVGLLSKGAREFADRTALVVDEDRETYAGLLDSALHVARALSGLGIQPGDRVGIVMHNSLDLLHVLFGCSLARAIAVPVNNRLSARELAYIVNDSGMSALFVGDHAREAVDLAGRVAEALPGLSDAPAGAQGSSAAVPGLKHVFLLGERELPGFSTRSALLECATGINAAELLDDAKTAGPEDPYMMLYTSGTTANPKGCVLPFRSIVKTGIAVGRLNFEVTTEDRLWNPLPMFHVSAQAPLTGVLDAGGCYISTVHFDGDAALAQIEAERATVLFPAYPAIMQPLINDPAKSAAALAKVRAVLNVGPPDLLEKFQAALPDHAVHVSCYGSTECGGIAVMGRVTDPLADRLTSGKPLEGVELEIRELYTDEPMPTGEKGAIWIKGYNLFQRYWNDEAKTAEVYDTDGWFNTGDLGKVDANGNMTFMGRAKDMLKVGGENVAAVEIESYLVTHPDVVMAAVVGKDDARLDEVPVAFVELASGAATSQDELIDYCRAGLAKFKVPREVHAITKWPMSTTKIQKFKLKEMLDAGKFDA
ncbi:class I adenylate-forming enzyme family protein [Streptomyces sp. NPDC046805]|uniref:class I adenylate-forming enzyme family protein n=1 Tax=Streptomyces sp. NPDC046805 TaxID=3155134 RepID=UPI00340FACFA